MREAPPYLTGLTGQSIVGPRDISPAFKMRGISGGAAPPLTGDAVWVEGRRCLALRGKEHAGGKAGQSMTDSPDISPPAFKLRSASGGAAPPLAGDAVGVRDDAALPCGARGAAGWRARDFGFLLRRYCAKMGSAAMGVRRARLGWRFGLGWAGCFAGRRGYGGLCPHPLKGPVP